MRKTVFFMLVLLMLSTSTAFAMSKEEWNAKRDKMCAAQYEQSAVPFRLMRGLMPDEKEAFVNVQKQNGKTPLWKMVMANSILNSVYNDKSYDTALAQCSKALYQYDPNGSQIESFEKAAAQARKKEIKEAEEHNKRFEEQQAADERMQLEIDKRSTVPGHMSLEERYKGIDRERYASEIEVAEQKRGADEYIKEQQNLLERERAADREKQKEQQKVEDDAAKERENQYRTERAKEAAKQQEAMQAEKKRMEEVDARRAEKDKEYEKMRAEQEAQNKANQPSKNKSLWSW